MNGLSRWTPTSDLARQRLSRLFDELWRDVPGGASREEVARGTWTPPVDIRETSETLEIQVELPGLSKGDVDISLEDNVLTLTGERRFDERDEGYHRIERAYGRFSRSFSLPGNVEREKVKASFKDGVLDVVLPKVEEAKPRKIAIS